MTLDFKDADCRWQLDDPGELHVAPHDTEGGKQLGKDLRASVGQVVGSAGYITNYVVEREENGVFVLTNAKRKMEEQDEGDANSDD